MKFKESKEYCRSSCTVFNWEIESASGRPFLQTWATSAWIRDCHSGCRASSIKHQEAVMAVVSWPAKYMFLQLSTINCWGEALPSVASLTAPSNISCIKSFWHEDVSTHSCWRPLTVSQINNSTSLSNVLIFLLLGKNLPIHYILASIYIYIYIDVVTLFNINIVHIF